MQSEKKLKLIDLSQPIFADGPHHPDDPGVQTRLAASHEKDGWLVEEMTLTTHSGSHLDAPLHKFPGAPSVNDFPLERYVGSAWVLDMRDCRAGQPFTSSMLSRKMRQLSDLGDQIVLLATGWGEKRGQAGSPDAEPPPFLAPDGADWLVEQEIRGVGIDAFSIGGYREPSNSLTHAKLLEANIWILEDLRFPEEVFALPQPVQFWALPVHLRKSSGAFCRPVIAVSV